MLSQAKDLLEEGEELHRILRELSASDWDQATPFKSWTINKIVGHLLASD